MPGKLRLIVMFLVAVLLSACSENESTAKTVDTDEASIVTVNYPLFYFTQQLADDLATVRLPVPAEIDPAQWNPQLVDVQQCKMPA